MGILDLFRSHKTKSTNVPKRTGCNAPLIEAIVELYDGKEGSYQRVFDLLEESELMVPLTEPYSPGKSTGGAFTIRTISGGTAILCFTHAQALHLWKPGQGSAVALSFLDVSRQVAGSNGNLDSIVIDHAGPIWLEIKRATFNGEIRWEMHWPKSPQDKGPDFKGHIS
ncbi:MAG: SseB family protein [Chlamydiae bacterium]|nr:SseB family protein [Chlamydiota bacterium]MBI3266050.1 SseB family protein [Chlamydiota bacterium]